MLIFTHRFYKIICISFLLLCNTLPVSSQTEYLVIVDPSSGNYTKLDSIPGVKYILLFELTTIDEKNKRFIFTGGPDQTNFNLIALDEVTGNTLTKFALPNSSIAGLSYSKSADILYGLIVNAGVYSLISVNTQSGAYSIIKTFQGITSIPNLILDDNGHRFFIQGVNNNGDLVLITMDIPTSNITSQTPFSNSIIDICYVFHFKSGIIFMYIKAVFTKIGEAIYYIKIFVWQHFKFTVGPEKGLAFNLWS